MFGPDSKVLSTDIQIALAMMNDKIDVLATASSSIDTRLAQRMLICLLLASLVGIASSTSSRTAEGCEVGDQWTENYIRFECYEGEGIVVKGVRAIGYVPSNSENGAMVAPGATFDEQYFTYNCTQSDEDTVTYQIKNCRDAVGSVLHVDESRKSKDGTDYRCYRDNKGAIKLAVGGGCIHKGKLYTVGQKWIENEQFKDKVSGKDLVIGNGSRLWCTGDAKSGFRVEAYGQFIDKVSGKDLVIGNGSRLWCTGDAKSGFRVEAYGCVVSTGVYLEDGGFTGIGKNFVQCRIEKTTAGKAGTTVSIKIVDESVVTCNDNGKIVKSGERYTTPAGDVLLCKYCVLQKIGCIFQGKEYKVGLILLGGKAYECTATGTGVFDFGPVTGCPMSDGSIKQFMSRWYKDTEAYQCRYEIKKGKVTTYIKVGCNNNGQTVVKYQVVGSGRNLKKCGLVPGKYYQMRDMTAAEIDAYYKSKSKSAPTADVFGGVGGSGSGDELLGKPNSEPGKDGGKNVETCIAMCTASCKS
ncbi:hypothetical protein PRIPAC_79075 [Pristionchus pacificus]|uniref:Abnormal cell migration protein 18-like fibronectin type I domain-containing protein n=1 Tax=Pristionchus pacificus TaxID=54126 RepID=A0A2A6CMW0_PRIPA|nr:hypothetical protein PRIPAC_79075 [Pristionchus pacificus]|eukprot:PDM79436.1 hypothetical protein PRIPAC_32015 [Pristionchus pacificus]